MAKLTKKELAWIGKVQKVLDECPSDRLGFYTIGDRAVLLYDLKKSDEICRIQDTPRGDYFCSAVKLANADFEECLTFPSQVESTAG
ncbi:hypothetical protein GKR67_02080 [Providencia alcalifaciens]|uniref:Uncharacterized protein n=1 Tax=Providencia alcalifaciens TaxID=126385 RepID=A0AAW9V6I2_9GAMM|nr:hypothetical protein [Providencia alcalifaciens]